MLKCGDAICKPLNKPLNMIFNQAFIPGSFPSDWKKIQHLPYSLKGNNETWWFLLLITHEIYKSFDDGLKVISVFLDISKALSKTCLSIDFREKTKLFNSFFSKQCPCITNHSKLWTSLGYLTHKRLSTITISVKEKRKINRSFNLNKDHDHDNLSIYKLKLCGDTICKPLDMIFNQV